MAKRRLEHRDVREWWVAEDQVERAGDAVKKGQHIGGRNMGAVRESGRREILPQRLQRLGRALDEHDTCRAPRERLDAERARPREEVEDTSVAEYGLEDREERLADPVRRRTGRAAARRVERPALGAPGDDPHASA